jgi:segregation and condensation protein A
MFDTFSTVKENLILELDEFDGPLDLLLYLIKRDEIDIYDIPIADITSQYLSYLEAVRELNLEIAGEFLYMASLLIRIKAQMLLPRPEDEEIWDDPRSELVNALLEYKKIKKISAALEQKASEMSKRFIRLGNQNNDLPKPDPDLVRVDITSLMIAFGDLLKRVDEIPSLNIRTQEVTVDQRKEHILTLLNSAESLEFDELFLDDPRKIVLVVTFIALLDLVKEGILKVEQAIRHTAIRVYLNNEPLLNLDN